MDPATALILLSLQPVHLDPHAAMLRGAFLPVIIPFDGLPAPTRAAWLLATDQVDPARRVTALLAAGRADDAFRLLGALDLPVAGGLARLLDGWIAQERARLALPPGDGTVLGLTAAVDANLLHETAVALDTVTAVLPLAWPRWAGPLVVVGADPMPDPLPGRTWLARPALPLLRCREPDRNRIAADLVGLALALSSPPAQGWPVWLRRGLTECCSRRVLGLPISPRQMRLDRQEAGTPGLRGLLVSGHPDPALALAVCTPLIQPGYQARFKVLLDLLRNGAGSEGAVRLAYGWTLADLVALR